MTTEHYKRIDECEPREWNIPEGITHICFRNRAEQPVSIDILLKTLENQPVRSKITDLTIDSDSRLINTDIAQLFPNLQWVKLRGKLLKEMQQLHKLKKLSHLFLDISKPSPLSFDLVPHLPLKRLSIRIRNHADIEPLARMRRLNSLWIGNWPLADLSPLANVLPCNFDMNGGKVETLEGLNTSTLKNGSSCIYRCFRLRSLKALNAGLIELAECRILDFGTVDAPDAVFLIAEFCREFNTFSFLRKCPLLTWVGIGAKATTATDYEHVLHAPSLRLLSFSRKTPDSVIRSIGKLGAKTFVTNQRLAYQLGEARDPKDADKIRDELSRQPGRNAKG